MINVLSVWAGLLCWITAAFVWGVVSGLVVLGAVLVGGPIVVAIASKQSNPPTPTQTESN